MLADDLGYPICTPVQCTICQWEGSSGELILHPSGSKGCPACIRTEGIKYLDDNMLETTSHTASLETVEQQEARHAQARRDAALSYPGEYDYTDGLDTKQEFPNDKELTPKLNPEPLPRLCPECNSPCSQGFIGTDDGETCSLWLCPNCGWNESETIPIDVVDFDVIDYVTWLGISDSDREEPAK